MKDVCGPVSAVGGYERQTPVQGDHALGFLPLAGVYSGLKEVRRANEEVEAKTAREIE